MFVIAYGRHGCDGEDVTMIVRASGGDCHDAGTVGFDTAFTADAAKLWGVPGNG